MECFIGLLSGGVCGNPLEPLVNHVESLGQFWSGDEAARAQAVGRPMGSDPLPGNPVRWEQL